MDARVFRYAKGRPWQRLVFLAAVLAFVALGVARFAADGGGAGGILSALLLAALGLHAFRGLYDRRPVLVLSEAGVWFRGWRLQHPIAWHDVTDVRSVPAARGEPFITLALKMDPAGRDGRPQLQFRTGALDVDNEEALRLVQAYWEASRRPQASES